ncbi:replication initiation protein [Corynebacterium sp. p3-SID1145]|uniref:replication initiation protein n=1 Tax=unclassified Corynebacterium TaxID=2624378 RepID=UPI0021AAD82C|nr:MULTISPECIES: replication initiation protein [unclassified Corynebacterium]MCT1453459.1 replication initiation protein [Corynebacterium sp. p3-SID1145]MCT1462550.1 replication initiation protein [Corynebacterium sp. p3-SID1140]
MNIPTFAGGGHYDAPTLDQFTDVELPQRTPFRPSLASITEDDLQLAQQRLSSPVGIYDRCEYAPCNIDNHPPMCGYIGSPSWTFDDAAYLLAHLGRTRFHVSKDRRFERAYWTRICAKCRAASTGESAAKQPSCTDDTCGVRRERTVPMSKLGDYEYIKLTHPHYCAILAVDIDIPGEPGGRLEVLSGKNQGLFSISLFADMNAEPNWVGINPVSGKAQAIWLIDPVYTDGAPGRPDRPMRLLKRIQTGFNEFLGGDKAFSHGFMRNPFYSGPNPNAYHWHAISNRIHKLKDLEHMLQVWDVLDADPATAPARKKTGTELILQAKANRERAQQMRALSNELDGLSIEELEQIDPSYIEGVRVLYDATGTPQRDETAFRHALKTAHRLHKRGQRLKDNLIIDAYEHAYRIAHAQDTTGRPNELPPMRDRLTMARRVRAYVTTNKTGKTAGTGLSSTQRVTPVERKVLRTFGARGGKKAAQRWNDPTQTEYQTNARKPLEVANKRRKLGASSIRLEIAAAVQKHEFELGTPPTMAEIAEEFGVSRETVKRALKQAGISLPRGRRGSSK